jgi:TetR/AcrR family transcriptional repressor of nem operon
MSRPIEFDRSKALDKAVALFWRKGYQATSLTDLLAATQIGRSSFYAAFTDKRSLFLTCMDVFAARTGDLLEHARATKPPLDVLEDFFQGKFFGGRESRRNWGCMLVNSVLEMAGVDEGIVARASAHLTGLQRYFETCLRDAGATPAQASELAAILMLFNEGIRVSNRRRLSRPQQAHTIAATFRLIRSVIAPGAVLEDETERETEGETKREPAGGPDGDHMSGTA